MKAVSPHTAAVSPERAKHLERNRIAANKCRERKKREHKQIERRLSDETEKKEMLLAQLNCLREEVWDLKNIIFQHAECDDHQINNQLRRMTQTAMGTQSVPQKAHSDMAAPDMAAPDMTVPDMSLSPTTSTKTWSDESVDESTNMTMNMIDPGAYPQGDWTGLPKVANDMVYDPNGSTDSLFENFIDADNLYT
ncbi:uncharacterized protein N7529_008191 [Penicillium soppii]|jgi:hypothetical protein|uniref:uncharacterized protein n=1 Tax=Penicillium soppii TaxID=69789 RepID=UPI0025472259|nr:uncharacterized protein N7529_008191 [Penicillium soppii]KAJ5860881.1 hypothetical protein N7529_008191 [Penicillium soppii]